MNQNSRIEEEMLNLLPWKPPLELAEISENEVSSYSFIHVDNNFFSVPEYLVGKKVTVNRYAQGIIVYSCNEEVCQHKRLEGRGNMQVNIYHYLNTLQKKSGAIRNSLALKSIPELKNIFDKHYSTRPRKFIDMLRKHSDLSLEKLLKVLQHKASMSEVSALDVVKSEQAHE